MISIELITNIIIPLLSGFFLFIYFMYFAFIEGEKSQSTRFFLVFLLSFSIFLLGRPVQILSGAHPVPLIINNVRSFIFSAITIPTVILVDFSRHEKKEKKLVFTLILIGSILGAIYSLFNTLTSTGSQVIFNLGTIYAYDTITPNITPPFYGREVTISVYLLLATTLFLDSLIKIKRIREINSRVKVKENQAYLYNVGKIIFALTFFIGSLSQQWWVYYVGSIFSIIFLGYGVNLSIKESKIQMNSVLSYIKENLIQELSIDVNINRRISDMLKLVNIPGDINTFIALKQSVEHSNQNLINPYIKGNNIKEISSLLEKLIGKNQFLIMPMGSDMLGICLSITSTSDSGRNVSVGICESLKTSLKGFVQYDFGIGRSYHKFDQMKISYKEAVYAVEYASSIEDGQIIHIIDIQESIVSSKFPANEKREFLSAIRLGDKLNALDKLESINNILIWYFNEEGKLLKTRVYGLIGAIIESGIAGGGAVDELLEFSDKLYAESAMIYSHSQFTEWIKSRTEEVIDIVARSHSSRSEKSVKKALQYIDEHFNEAITVKDVANAVCISESYLKALFKSCGSKSYTEYLIAARINRAKVLLRTTDKTIGEVAMDVGYQTPNAFSSIFKRETGYTPTQYKKN